MSQSMVGIVYALSSCIGIVFIPYMARMLRFFGNFWITLGSAISLTTGLLLLSIPNNILFIIIGFSLYLIANGGLFLSLNIWLEDYTNEDSTGEIRGLFLTIVNTGILLAPILGSLLMNIGSYPLLYYIAACFSLPIICIIGFGFYKYKDPKYQDPTLISSLRFAYLHKNIRRILFIQFILEFFYTWMVIYAPLYLESVGVPIETILGVIMPIALTPFVISPIVTGWLADKKYGEVEMLTVGFIGMAITLGFLAFPHTNTVLFFALLFFFNRLGAALVETMTESYFFKQVNVKEVTLITLFRTTRSFALILGPLTASILLLYIEPQYLFIVLAGIMLFGGATAITLTDTK